MDEAMSEKQLEQVAEEVENADSRELKDDRSSMSRHSAATAGKKNALHTRAHRAIVLLDRVSSLREYQSFALPDDSS